MTTKITRNTEGVPVRYVPNFCTNTVEALWASLPFDRIGNVPRNECWMNDYGQPYTYGTGDFSRTYQSVPWDAFVDGIRHKLNAEFGTSFDCCFCNGYKDQHDSLFWHSDDSPEMDMNHAIASVTIGAEREIWFRPKGTKGVTDKGVLMGHGSVVFMEPGMQATWDHRIPKHSQPCGPRISMTYCKLVR